MKIKYHNLALLVMFNKRRLLLKQQLAQSVVNTNTDTDTDTDNVVFTPPLHTIEKYKIHYNTPTIHWIKPYIKLEENKIIHIRGSMRTT